MTALTSAGLGSGPARSLPIAAAGPTGCSSAIPISMWGEWEPFTSGPHNRFGGVIVVEKGGIADVLQQVGLDRRHDVAIVGNEGQSVEAELKLVDACGRAEVPVFLLTDFDRQGFTIAENLRAGTWRTATPRRRRWCTSACGLSRSTTLAAWPASRAKAARGRADR